MADHHEDAEGLRATEEQLGQSGRLFLSEVERLSELEQRKQGLSPGDAERLDLAREVEDVTLGLMSLSRYQTRLIALQDQTLGEPERQTRSPAAILEEWRAAERRLHEARATIERVADDADRLRAEHREAMARRRS